LSGGLLEMTGQCRLHDATIMAEGVAIMDPRNSTKQWCFLCCHSSHLSTLLCDQHGGS